MKALFNLPLSSRLLWEISFLLLSLYLLAYPPLAFPQSYAVALGGGLLLLLFRSLTPEATAIPGKAWWLLLLFLPLSAFWSLQPGVTLQSAGFVFLGTILFLMFRSHGPADQSRMEVFGLLLAGLAAFLALKQWLYGFEETQALLPQLPPHDFRLAEKAVFYHRATGCLVTPGALAALMVLFIPLGFTLALIGRGFKRWFFGLLTVLLCLALLVTQSVGAFIALTLAGLAVLVVRRSWLGFFTILVAGLAAIVGVVWARGFQHWDISSFSGRVGLWNHAFQLFLQHPLFGSGLGTFGEAYQEAGFPLGSGASKFAHNILLQFLVETGLVGTTLFLGALFSLVRRFKVPSRWEGWGAMTGVLAFLLFSLLDLPFQMPELVFLFCLLAGRLEFKPGIPFRWPSVSTAWVEWGVLGALLVSGFWHPFRPWNMALVACVLWAAMAFFQQKLEAMPFWIFAGGVFIALRAFVSPSALGAAWFLETAGLVLAFGLLLRGLPDPQRFFKWFCGLGLVWALQVWIFSFQYSDIKYWTIFPNPKHVGIFLLSLLFLQTTAPLDWKTLPASFRRGKGALKKLLLFLYSAATLVCLKAFSAMVGLAAGTAVWAKKQQRAWMAVGACLFIAMVLAFRVLVFSSLDKTTTQWDRLVIWKAAVEVWSREPLEGVGPGAFAGLFQQVKSPRSSGVSRYLMDAPYAHNEFLEFLTVFGLAGFVWGFFLMKKLWFSQTPGRKAALAALGTASFFDFCLHTPLIALQGAGLLTPEGNKGPKPSGAAALSFSAPGFKGGLAPLGIGKGVHRGKLPCERSGTTGLLAAGLALGLFGSAAFGPALREQSEKLQQTNQLSQALRCLETAEKLNAWDARYPAVRSDYLEKLFLATKDTDWARRADEAFERVWILEQTDGQWKLENARRLTHRLDSLATPSAVQTAQKAWKEAEQAMPFNALVLFEEGLFHLASGDKASALSDFQKAVELEPNYAAAWVNLGLLLKEKGEKAQAHSAFQTALGVFDQWKDAQRISGLEKDMVSLPPATVTFLRKEASR